jgi:hypothetical protein
MKASQQFKRTDGGREASGFIEWNDCTVRALACVTDTPYAEAHRIFCGIGRGVGKRASFGEMLRAHEYCVRGYIASPLVLSPRTVAQFLKQAKQQGGRYVVRTRGHVFAVVDGIILDESPEGARRQVCEVFKFDRITAPTQIAKQTARASRPAQLSLWS